jgi:flagellar hook-associated protein 2
VASTGSVGIDGLISGLDTTAVIDKLMAAEGNQRTLLSSKKSGMDSLVTALQSLNTKTASLATAAQAALKSTSWQATSATSSAKSVTATTTSSAQPASLTLTVDKLAASQSTLYTLPESYADSRPSFTLTTGGETKTITALSSHIGDLVAAFNAEGTGVTASAVNVGTTAAPVYKLQLTGTQTGKDHLFSVAATNATGSTPMAGQELRAASDAEVTLWPGSAGATKVSSASNSFKELLTGVDLTVSEVSTDNVTVTISRSSAAMSTLASNLVSNLNAVLGDIADRTKLSTKTAADGGAIVSGGLFSGNTAIRMLQQDLGAAGSTATGSTSAASVGIVLNKDGTFTFDSAAFSAAYAADPAGAQKTVQAIATKLESAATAASDTTKGTLTTQITSNKDEVKTLTDKIASWDDRLATRRAALVKTYAAMEVAMSKMQSTSNFLTQQLAQINANSSS